LHADSDPPKPVRQTAVSDYFLNESLSNCWGKEGRLPRVKRHEVSFVIAEWCYSEATVKSTAELNAVQKQSGFKMKHGAASNI